MHLLSHLAVCLLIFLPVCKARLPVNTSIKWVVTEGCFLKVGGSTNINKFTCEIVGNYQSDTLILYKNNNTGPLKLSGKISLDVQAFNCHNPMMSADLRKTLKANEYPQLVIRFVSLERYPRFDQPEELRGTVAIELAGTTRLLDIDYKFNPGGTGILNLTGSRQVNFSDFGLVPPRKMGGMIKTNEALFVQFNLAIKVAR
ncbi:YceI family protein [Hufsiella ginkgonis]|uniref:YceI family protein n=1 Tax=Hufsiella ginkgonis TaxID=2695274 RepID=A0A7K1Y0D1_9SPHI|nr:YceI family protein [Hufsiella ginkgonis]MXV16734.1 YceI family protein [Hufsiella ginkgonis]